MLEGLLEQETGLNPTEIMTDTAGASDLVFGLFLLLGYQFSPRLADAGASVFWRMDNNADYGVLNDIARGQSDPQKRRQRKKTLLNVSFRTTERQTPIRAFSVLAVLLLLLSRGIFGMATIISSWMT